ncbi:MAG: hypothetical protein P8Y38_03370 [Deltaproteobacteria bacterium]|jgi:hypothetical protein
MRDDPNPLFRKIIAPWYDSELACVLTMVLMVVTACFGGLGIAVAVQNPVYAELVGLPLLLLIMSLYVLISSGVRLFRRKRGRYSKLD